MKKEEIIYDSRDGVTKIHAKRWIPEGEIKGVLQIIHGMAEHIDRYEHVAEWFVDKGFVVTGDDHLGHGATVPEGGLFGYFCEQDPATVVVRDVHRLKKMTQEAYPGVPYFIWGHSMGSIILRNYIVRYGTGIDGAIICGTAGNPKLVVKTAKCIARIQNLFLGGKPIAKLLSRLTFGDDSKDGKEKEEEGGWLCTDNDVIKKYDSDKWCGFTFTINGYLTLFTLLDRVNNKKNLSKMPKDLPIFMISGSEDSVGECGKGVKRVYESLLSVGMKDVKLKLYEGMRHEIHNEPIKETVFDDVYTFMKSKANV